MKKSFLIISLIVGLFLVMSGGVAMAADATHNEVKILGDTGVNIDQKATLFIKQPVVNAPYVLEVDDRREWTDTIPLLIQGGTITNPLGTVVVIRDLGDGEPEYGYNGEAKLKVINNPRESELRFDNGRWGDSANSSEFSFINAAIYTWGNDQILRLRPGPFVSSTWGELSTYVHKYDDV